MPIYELYFPFSFGNKWIFEYFVHLKNQQFNTIREIELDFNFRLFSERGSPHNVVANVLDCDIVISEFEFQLSYYAHFWTNISPHPQLWDKYYHYSSTRMSLTLNYPRRLICHWTKKPNQTKPNWRRLLKIQYLISMHSIRWLTNFTISVSNEQLQQQLEYTLLKPDYHSWWISKMQSGREDTLEERYAIKFCFKLGKKATETYWMLQTAFGASCMNQASVFEWYKRFKKGRESVRDDERCVRSKEVNTPELIGQRVRVRVTMLRF